MSARYDTDKHVCRIGQARRIRLAAGADDAALRESLGTDSRVLRPIETLDSPSERVFAKNFFARRSASDCRRRDADKPVACEVHRHAASRAEKGYMPQKCRWNRCFGDVADLRCDAMRAKTFFMQLTRRSLRQAMRLAAKRAGYTQN